MPLYSMLEINNQNIRGAAKLFFQNRNLLVFLICKNISRHQYTLQENKSSTSPSIAPPLQVGMTQLFILEILDMINLIESMKGRGFETAKCAPKCCEVLSTAVH